MTPQERANLAEQLQANPLYKELFDGLERNAVEALVYAPDDQTRLEGALRVKAIRSFRSDCDASLRNIRERKAAPA